MIAIVIIIFLLVIVFVMSYHIIVAHERWEYTRRALRASQYAAWNAAVSAQGHHRPMPAKKDKCCEKKNDDLTFLITMLLHSKLNSNPNMANTKCIERVMTNVVPSVSAKLRARGIDANDIDYNNPLVKELVNESISEALNSGLCHGMPIVVPPKQCPTPIVNIRK